MRPVQGVDIRGQARYRHGECGNLGQYQAAGSALQLTQWQRFLPPCLAR